MPRGTLPHKGPCLSSFSSGPSLAAPVSRPSAQGLSGGPHQPSGGTGAACETTHPRSPDPSRYLPGPVMGVGLATWTTRRPHTCLWGLGSVGEVDGPGLMPLPTLLPVSPDPAVQDLCGRAPLRPPPTWPLLAMFTLEAELDPAHKTEFSGCRSTSGSKLSRGCGRACGLGAVGPAFG